MMWIFGQVWFACLVGFAVGVLLDWVVRVRPLSERVADLEARLARSTRQDARSGASEYGGSDFGSDLARREVDRSGFGSGSLEADAFGSTGFGRERTSVFATPDSNVGLATDLLEDEPPPARTEVVSGVEDYPGVARLNEAWASAEPEPEPAPPAEPAQPTTWQPGSPENNWQDEPAEQVTQVNGSAITQPTPVHPSESESDEQYMEFLRSGSAPASGLSQDDGYAQQDNGYAQQDKGYAQQDDGYAAPQDEGYAGQDNGYAFGGDPEQTNAGQDVEEPGASEVTSVLPYAITEDGQEQQQDGYQAYEGYQQDGYQQDGYQDSFQPLDYQHVEYQDEYVEPEESSGPLPHRGGGGDVNSPRYAPFEIPFGMSENDLGESQPRSGELTPIQEGGFQPFAKPDDEVVNGSNGDAWAGDDTYLLGNVMLDETLVPGPPAMMPGGEDDGSSTWFDLNAPREDESEGPQGWAQVSSRAGLTQRMLPVSTPDVDHPDLLGTSVFGEDGDLEYAPDGPARSLFEPVIPSDVQDDGYDTPAPAEAPVEQSEPAPDPMGDPLSSAPRPFRVRTGTDNPPSGGGMQFPGMPLAGATSFSGGALSDGEPLSQHHDVDVDDSQHDTGSPAGPFGPGSALPLADGSAPSTQFRVKARTSSMVFHTESSPFYERLEPQVWFRDPQDAQRAGFTSWERPRSW